MKELTLVEVARGKVNQLETEARSALKKKESLERGALREQQEGEAFSGLTARFTKSGRIEWITNQVVKAFGSDRAPEKLPPEPVVPKLSLTVQAKLAHVDYVGLCYGLNAAKAELVALEAKVADTAALMRCVA